MMMITTKLPPPKFQRDGERYIVMCGDDRVGFVRRVSSLCWNAIDTTMEKSRDFSTRQIAARWLAKELAAALDRGEF
jgi:hypothetical protein